MSTELVKIPISNDQCQPYIKQGDTIDVIEWDVEDDYGEDLTTDHIIRIQLYLGSQRVANFDSASNGGITITGANTFEIDKISENDFPCGVLKGDVQIEKYMDFAQDPEDVFTYCNIEYYITKQYTKRP